MENFLRINYKKLDEKAVTPFKAINIDAGFDLTAISIRETDKFIEYRTGIAFEMPEGYVGLLFPRSSVTKMDLMLKNSVGVIDASYRGEIMFRFIKAHNDVFAEGNNDNVQATPSGPVRYDGNWVNANHIAFRKTDYYKVGDRVGQIVFVPIPVVELTEVDEINNTERGSGGFGHTGR